MIPIIPSRLSLPIFLGLLVRFLDGNFSWKFGYILAAGFVLTVFLSSLIFHPCIFECQKIGMQVRIGLTNLIYKKVYFFYVNEVSAHFLKILYS